MVGCTMFAQVGININTNDPKTTLDVNGAISLKASSTLNLPTVNNVDINVEGFSLFNITGPTEAFNINSIKPVAGVDGQIVTFVNNTVHNMTILNDSGASDNSIYCPNGAGLTLSGRYSTVTFQYDNKQERWIVIKYSDKENFGNSIYKSVGVDDTQTSSTSFSDMVDMSYEFIPKKSIVYVNVSASGNMSGGISTRDGYGDFRIVNVTAGNSIVAGATTLASDNVYNAGSTSWNIRMVMIPVNVTANVPNTIKVQWRKGGDVALTLNCNTTTGDLFSHRNITILD